MERLSAVAKNGERDRHEVVIMLLFIWGMNKKRPLANTKWAIEDQA